MARRLQHEWKQLQAEHASNIVFHKQYVMQLQQALADHPEFQSDIVNGVGLSLSLSNEVAAVFPFQDIILFPTNSTLTAWTAYLTGMFRLLLPFAVFI
jgi:hypothetical protein